MRRNLGTLADDLVTLGIELMDSGYAEVPGDLRSDCIDNIKHYVAHQLEYINIWHSEERGFYLDTGNYAALGIFTAFQNDEKRKHNEDALMQEINKYINYLAEARKQAINIIGEAIQKANAARIVSDLLVLPESLIGLSLGQYLFGVKIKYKTLFDEHTCILLSIAAHEKFLEHSPLHGIKFKVEV